MRLPTPLSRRNPNLNKYDFGHALVIAGSARMLGAACLTSLAAMRSGAGLVTAAIPYPLNLTLQRKISHVVMTLPYKNYTDIEKVWGKYQALAIGPGMGREGKTERLILRVIEGFKGPMIVDADALNALAGDVDILKKAKGPRILTPHAGEMARLTKLDPKAFAKAYNCILLLKGPRTIVASSQGKTYINKTGNVGLATAGSGDVLTGIITGLLAQGLSPFEAAKYGAYYHGKAADQAVKAKTKASLIASDLLDYLYK